MAKFYGEIGFATLERGDGGIVKEKIVEKLYFGDLIKTTRRLETSSEQINDNLELSNDISIIADGYATDNIGAIRYVRIGGSRWKVKTVELRYPKLILNVGGLYNGEQTTGISDDSGVGYPRFG